MGKYILALLYACLAWASPVRAGEPGADPAVWGDFAEVAGRTASGGERAYTLRWQWQVPGQVLVQEYLNPGDGSVANREEIQPGNAPGRLLLTSSVLGNKQWNGTLQADGSVLFIGKGLLKLPYRVGLSDDGAWEVRRVKLDGERIASILPVDDYNHFVFLGASSDTAVAVAVATDPAGGAAQPIGGAGTASIAMDGSAWSILEALVGTYWSPNHLDDAPDVQVRVDSISRDRKGRIELLQRTYGIGSSTWTFSPGDSPDVVQAELSDGYAKRSVVFRRTAGGVLVSEWHRRPYSFWRDFGMASKDESRTRIVSSGPGDYLIETIWRPEDDRRDMPFPGETTPMIGYSAGEAGVLVARGEAVERRNWEAVMARNEADKAARSAERWATFGAIAQGLAVGTMAAMESQQAMEAQLQGSIDQGLAQGAAMYAQTQAQQAQQIRQAQEAQQAQMQMQQAQAQLAQAQAQTQTQAVVGVGRSLADSSSASGTAAGGASPSCASTGPQLRPQSTPYIVGSRAEAEARLAALAAPSCTGGGGGHFTDETCVESQGMWSCRRQFVCDVPLCYASPAQGSAQ
ncbi:hypothetical protein [Marilutibacter spongiae]|uniref:Uncharacterized protein n=1 Tax=Marilutibacter spongiae TaxID=2025720 RepID=A0A7W3Y4V2_9GAMM|nr:hypothetical protein [Lysobacter spongiae]MBB1059537.1 hypothetical protein [Lysobacter spongiae]